MVSLKMHVIFQYTYHYYTKISLENQGVFKEMRCKYAVFMHFFRFGETKRGGYCTKGFLQYPPTTLVWFVSFTVGLFRCRIRTESADLLPRR